jgi:hypothetical protein
LVVEPISEISVTSANAALACASTAAHGPDSAISAGEFAAHSKRGFAVGWRLHVSFSDRSCQLDLLLPKQTKMELVYQYLTGPRFSC